MYLAVFHYEQATEKRHGFGQYVHTIAHVADNLGASRVALKIGTLYGMEIIINGRPGSVQVCFGGELIKCKQKPHARAQQHV